PALERGRGRIEAVRLGRDDAEVEGLDRVRVRGGPDADMEVAPARDTEPLAVQRLRVVLAAREDADVGHLCQMPREQAADRPSADHAHALDQAASAATAQTQT